MRIRWGQLYRHAILIAVLPEEMRLPEEPTPLATFDPSVPDGASIQDRLTTYLDARDVWEWALGAGCLYTDPCLLEHARAEALETIQKRRKRASLKERGVPRSEWPDTLIDTPPETPPSKTVRFGDEDEAPLLAQRLREAMEHKSVRS
jgi:hypothetical protein